jgi:hypothetical protein
MIEHELTPELIANYPACDRLNMLISRYCFGWTEIEQDEHTGQYIGVDPETEKRTWVPLYSSSFDSLFIPSAMIRHFGDPGQLLFNHDTNRYVFLVRDVAGEADTQPLAISRAALLAMLTKDKHDA